MITIRYSFVITIDEKTTSQTRRNDSRFASSLTELLVVIALIADLTALTLTAVQAAREAGRRSPIALETW